ncbi:hypothetical protein JIG36_51020 [Actinoplanes sp. LDG1-06]|uniref:Uncharacterized protein n=1 Tax=Paractinoplanes ovalisporus TaxID=2810368 RepID=A0ABS2AVF0_9ACTN|nr:hypothetical protein [Actinoplanes ovalisporus]MBM2623852.1 hypothetical protein [Actinoplanes ovalisporus]
MGKVKTGTTSEYDASDEVELVDSLDEAEETYGGGTPTRMGITADIEWAGTRNPRANRSTTLDGLNLRPVLTALAAYRAAVGRVAEAGRGIERAERAYGAKGWHAQLVAIERTRAGRAAADRAGLNPTRRTFERWMSGGRPNAANRARIAEAYGSVRAERVERERGAVGRAQSAAASARHAVAQALSAAVSDRYGAEVRFREISNLTFHP